MTSVLQKDRKFSITRSVLWKISRIILPARNSHNFRLDRNAEISPKLHANSLPFYNGSTLIEFPRSHSSCKIRFGNLRSFSNAHASQNTRRTFLIPLLNNCQNNSRFLIGNQKVLNFHHIRIWSSLVWKFRFRFIDCSLWHPWIALGNFNAPIDSTTYLEKILNRGGFDILTLFND